MLTVVLLMPVLVVLLCHSSWNGFCQKGRRVSSSLLPYCPSAPGGLSAEHGGQLYREKRVQYRYHWMVARAKQLLKVAAVNHQTATV
jgi:hypothetical protein